MQARLSSGHHHHIAAAERPGSEGLRQGQEAGEVAGVIEGTAGAVGGERLGPALLVLPGGDGGLSGGELLLDLPVVVVARSGCRFVGGDPVAGRLPALPALPARRAGDWVHRVAQLVPAALPTHDLVAEVARVGQNFADRGAAPHAGRSRMPVGADLARAGLW